MWQFSLFFYWTFKWEKWAFDLESCAGWLHVLRLIDLIQMCFLSFHWDVLQSQLKMASVWFRSNSPMNKRQIYIGRESWVFTNRGEARIKPSKPGRGFRELFDKENERKLIKNEKRKKHCQNCKTLPREQLIGCQGVNMFLLKDQFKKNRHKWRFVIIQVLSLFEFFNFVTIWVLSQF